MGASPALASTLKILNLGCGSERIEGAINIDIVDSFKPDLVCDFRGPLPFEPESVSKVYLFHVIEHLPKKIHADLLENINRVLVLGGVLYVSYPEFTRCARYFIDNHKGQREFWEATIYGRQTQPFDYHISLMYTPHFVSLLKSYGFDVETQSETEEWNTICKCTKVRNPMNIETVYKDKWFGEEVQHANDKTPDAEKNPAEHT